MAKTKICHGCYQPFIGRRNAKSCSARCRKRLQRTRQLLVSETLSTSRSATYGRRPTARVMGVWVAMCVLALWSSLAGSGSALSRGYTTTEPGLKSGMVVALSADSDSSIRSADFDDGEKAIGIVSNQTEDLLTEAPVGSQVYVVQSGQAKAFVSDLNGQVKKGDLLMLSNVRGVLVRAPDKSVTTIGIALEDFVTSSAQPVSIKDNAGDSIDSRVGLVNINVDIQPPSLVSAVENSNNILDRLSLSLTGREVNGLRVLTALAIFSTLLVIEGEIIYGTITSSITALGRNPMAKGLIGRQSLKSISAGLLILTVGTAFIVALLWV